MKRSVLFLLFVIAYTGVSAKDIVAYFDYKTFYSPGDGGILETYLNFDGSSVYYSSADDGLVQAKVEITIVIKDGDKIVDFIKKEISSPQIHDLEYVNFLDQSRFLLPKGDYSIEVQLRDVNSDSQQSYDFNKKINLDYNEFDSFFSDIELISGYRTADEGSALAKSGYDLIPFFSNYYSKDFGELMFYVEVYNLDKKLGTNEPILLSYSIEDTNNGSVIGNLRKFSKLNASPVVSHLGNFNLDQLYSGTYTLKIEIRDSENNVITSKETKIIRQNTNLNVSYNEEEINETFVGRIESKERLIEYIDYLRPICESSELMVLNNTEDLDVLRMKSFFYSFWRSRSNDNPEGAWLNYLKRVNIANEKYGTRLFSGTDTDQGRIFLKYGEPTSVYVESQPQFVFPFEIWHYRDIDGRFLFYSPQMVQENYYLLHSNLTKEVNNPNWLNELHRVKVSRGTDVDLNEKKNNNRIKELFNNPR